MQNVIKQGVVICIFIVSLFVLNGCEDTVTEPVGDAHSVVNGTVRLPDGSPVPDADVLATSPAFGSASTTTDENGEYTLTLAVDPDASATEYTLTVSKSGFEPRSRTIPLSPGGQVALNFTFGIDDDDEEPRPESGEAANIVVTGVQSESIGVKGSGFDETTRLVFEARDSDGIPVDLNHQILVMFSISGGPGGGEFLSKISDSTDANGQVTVVLNSGTVSGAVQVLAEANVIDRTISSAPVRLTIHGGLPAQEHFGMAPERYNFPALQRVNDRLGIVTVVGDKFSNPVRPGTSVYYRTKAGNIQTDALTDNDGVVNVQLISHGKNITDPVHGNGFGYVVAETWGENGTLVADSVLVLLSGSPIIDVDPGTFSVPNNQSQTFSYTVADYNGNPMAEGQTISVSLQLPELPEGQEPPQIILSGQTEVRLPDTQSQVYTQYSFTLSVHGGEEEGVVSDMPLGIVISTSGPNGDAELLVEGSVN